MSQDCKSVAEYTAKLELNAGRLDSSDEGTLMQLFIWVLHRHIADRVSISQPNSLSQAIATAEEIELTIKFFRTPPAQNLIMAIRVTKIQDRRVPLHRETQRDSGAVVEDGEVDFQAGLLVVPNSIRLVRCNHHDRYTKTLST